MFKIGQDKELAKQMAAAYKSGDEKQISQAWDDYTAKLQENIKQDYDNFLNEFDNKVLSSRGYHMLTPKEQNWYQKWIDSAKTSNPKQAFADLIETESMPETIIEDVYNNLRTEHPLLSKIQFRDVKFLTNWLLNKKSKDRAIWGEITSAITKKIEGSFKKLEIVQNKLSAFVILSRDMLDLGPVWLDGYVREILKEAIALGLEYGIIYGSGIKGEPIGLNRNVAKGVTINTNTGYPEKTPIKVVNFLPENYGGLIADNICKDEDGNVKILPEVSIITNPIDYLKKIMPATTVMTNQGTYVNNLFPYPTSVIQSIMIDEGEAILADLPNYFLGIGHSKDAVIEYSDEVKFFEDQRAYKAKMYADGRPVDNNVSAVLDITELEAAYITVLNKNAIVETSTPVTPDESVEQG